MANTSAMDFPDGKNINENDYKKQYEEILAKVDEQEKILVLDINRQYKLLKIQNRLNQDRTRLMKELSQYKNTAFKQMNNTISENGKEIIIII